MIDILFYFGGDIILVKIQGVNITFATSQYGNVQAPIEGLQLNYVGVCREHPDLELRDDWKEEAIRRFKEKIKSMKDEDEIAQYIISDLSHYGYVAQYKQKQGFRREKL